MAFRQLATVTRASSSRMAARSLSTSPSAVSLSNIEASWKSLTPAEQESTFKALEELQKKDWKELSLDEKKASYYVAFGPHGPREPIAASGTSTLAGVAVAVAVAGGLFAIVRSLGQEKPKTMTKEWQEAANEKAVEQKMDPFTGPASANYKGSGNVSSIDADR
ncbi:cytochrome c oxidase subunit IV-domain-containing protein [Leucosporidium creatinivorum]|uniref:Cytochrome c oxidase subunit IV-domain-containing protein n=1 Tax=Leucosporidium creatinivorum TaxID=106004 RepID=A0A1Y2CBK5_9BASI|nr:cytochrome c oxidase subunit IV-domain-containing protein [Leucosporidium creatinivorum]